MEEDLAFSSIAQDEMAHARILYGLAGERTGLDEDALAFGRRPQEYRNAVLCERPNGDWGTTIARQYLYDTADDVRTADLERSSWRELAEAVTLMRMEERYHLQHARAWFDRLANGPVTARGHLARGLEATVGEALALFEPLPGEEALLAEGVMPRPSEALLADWLDALGRDLESVSLDYVLERHARVGEAVPTSSGDLPETETLAVPGIERADGRWVHRGAFAGAGGRHGRHSPDLAELWEEMTSLYRAHPGARW
jgi:ring-1,2-phenylacetyl-CoA epoxidase subunit PaaC